jgi:DNA repair exonuclease SbcCD ATPase subunit
MSPTVARIARRSLVTFGVIGSLALGTLTIRAAAAWTAAEAPLVAPPVSIATLQAEVAAERERSAALEDNLASVAGRTAELTAALDTATARLAADQEAAEALRERLATAKTKLARLNRELAAVRRAAASAQAAAARAAAPPAAAAPARDNDGRDDDDEERDDDD